MGWADNSTDETGFAIERCTGATCSPSTTVATVAANLTSYADSGLAASTTYGYRVRAVRNSDVSWWSNTASATTQAATGTAPSAPTAFTASAASASRVVLAWTDTSGNETGFRIQRCTGSKCTNFAFLTTVGANVTIYPDNGLSASTSYRYRIQAYNDVGDSAWSSIATVKTLRR